jgi:glutamyl-tRNA(Gln) amidotransferase subunit E
MGQRVLAVRLPWFRGLMRHPTGPSAAFDSELQGRIRVIACLDRFPNLLHDDAADSALGVAEWEAIRRELAAGGQDVALLVWGPPEDARTAAAEVLVRCREALVGVPAETRRALPDGSTTFERILSLRSSMCEDTDHPPLPITRERIASLAERLAAPPAESQSAFEAAGLPRDIARTMASDPRKRVFEKLLALPGAAPMRAWRLVGQAMRSLRRRGVPVDRIPDERIEDLFGYWNRGAFASAALPDLIVELATHPERPAADVVARMAPPPASEALAATVRRALTGTDWRRPGRPNKEFLLAMRIAMRTLGKSVSGAQVAAVVTSLLGQEDAL